MNEGWNQKNDGRLVGGEDKASCKMRKGKIDGSNRGIWKCPLKSKPPISVKLFNSSLKLLQMQGSLAWWVIRVLLDYLPHYADGSDHVFRVLTQTHIWNQFHPHFAHTCTNFLKVHIILFVSILYVCVYKSVCPLFAWPGCMWALCVFCKLPCFYCRWCNMAPGL